MNSFLINLFEVDFESLRVIMTMVAAGVFLLQQTTEKTAACMIFAPVMLLCALAVRAAALPIGMYLLMEEGEYLVFSTAIGMCISLGIFVAYSRATSTMN
ncbi:MAG: hypothetical protein U1E49_05565 [Hyphomicrobiaceae bacterium]